jgi:redox-sensitive bicupin YhaK (pirin superfamily)
MSSKTVVHVSRIERRRRSAGLSIAQLHREHLPEHLDPFLAFDHFEMAQPFFPPHPHAGFSAVTYMFPESENGFVNRDSRGETIEIDPGDLHWTAAGAGIMHEEVPIRRGVICHGLQIFVNLASSKKWMTPLVLHLDVKDVPVVQTSSVITRVVFGSHGDVRSPIDVPTQATLLDVVLNPGGHFLHRPPPGETRFVYVIDGDLQVGPIDRPTQLRAGDAAGFSTEGDDVLACAADHPAHVVVAGGRPLHEPVVFYGPFCMSNREDIERAIRDYEAGKMGRLDPSF